MRTACNSQSNEIPVSYTHLFISKYDMTGIRKGSLALAEQVKMCIRDRDYGHQAVAVMLSCWYTSEKIINTFAAGGFHTIGALKTNRMLYPFGFKKKLNEFAAFLTSTRSNFRLVTVKKQKYYVYRYEGKLNGIENAVVLLSYPEKAFGNPKALRAFLSTDVSLSLDETLSYYVCR